MKKHLSVLMLMVRSTFYKVLGIMILMCGAQFGMFALTLNRLKERGTLSLEFVIEKSYTNLILFFAFMAIFILLASTGSSKKHRVDYTLNRLRISENWIFFWQTIYNSLVFVFLVFIQIIVILFLCHHYIENSSDSTITHQTVLLACYRNVLMHSLLPFDEPYSIAANIIVIFNMGIVSTLVPFTERHGKGTGMMVYLGLWSAVYGFRRDLNDFANNLLIFLIAAIIIGYTIYFLLTKEARHGN